MARRTEPVDIKIASVETDHGGLFVATSVETGDLVGQMTFVQENDHLIRVDHTLVESEYEGQGVAGKLTRHMIDYAHQKQLRVIPECSYVQVYFERHTEDVNEIWAR